MKGIKWVVLNTLKTLTMEKVSENIWLWLQKGRNNFPAENDCGWTTQHNSVWRILENAVRFGSYANDSTIILKAIQMDS